MRNPENFLYLPLPSARQFGRNGQDVVGGWFIPFRANDAGSQKLREHIPQHPVLPTRAVKPLQKLRVGCSR